MTKIATARPAKKQFVTFFHFEVNPLRSPVMKSLIALFLVGFLFLSGVCENARVQEISAAPTSAPAPSIPPNADPATATRAWLDTVPADKRAKSDAYFEGGYWLILWDFLMAATISIFLLASGISA